MMFSLYDLDKFHSTTKKICPFRHPVIKYLPEDEDCSEQFERCKSVILFRVLRLIIYCFSYQITYPFPKYVFIQNRICCKPIENLFHNQKLTFLANIYSENNCFRDVIFYWLNFSTKFIIHEPHRLSLPTFFYHLSHSPNLLFTSLPIKVLRRYIFWCNELNIDVES